MTFFKLFLVVLGSLLISTSASILDSLKQCKAQDGDCHKNNIQNVLNKYSKTGIEELKMPPLDPLELKDIDASVMNVVKLIIKEATVKGVRNCVIQKFQLSLQKLRVNIELTCDLVIKAKYNVQSEGEIIKSVLGGDVHGEGNGKVKIDKINVKISFPVEVEKRGEDYFMTSDIKKYQYSFDILGRVVFAADNVYVGEKESSKQVLGLMNDNWRPLVTTVGNQFFGIAMKYMHKFLYQFFASVPANSYLAEDLSAYVK